MEHPHDETVEVYKPGSELEANIIRDVLKQNEIEAGFRSNWSSWYDGIFVTAMGPGSIFVFKKDADRAKELIEDYRHSLQDYKDTQKEE